MRLTLRTLLAYLDDVLDPADKEELGKKIESSDFAGDLILRVRDTMRRLRLSAPHVVGSGMGLDPNTVAEYLDNALAPDQVGDFERICLESDMHLAEVASCHHVLTMVLGAPADVDAATKARMYSIPHEARDGRHLRIEPAHAATTVATVRPATPVVSSILATAPPSAASTSTFQASTEVPEYLRAGGWSGSRAVMVGLAALVLVAATILLAAGLTDWFGGETQTAGVTPAAPAAAEIENGTENGAVADTANGDVEDDESGATDDRGPAVAAQQYPRPGSLPTEESGSLESETPSLGSLPPVFTPGVTGPSVTTEQTDDDESSAWVEPIAESPDALSTSSDTFTPPVAEEPQDAPAGEAVVGERYATLPAATAAAAAASDEATVDAPPIPPTITPLAEPPVTADTATGDEVNVVTGAVGAAKPQAADESVDQVPELGTYLGGKTVLLRWNESEGAWYRMPPRSAVVSGDELLALPEFRPEISLASGVHLDLSGGTRIGVNYAESEAADAPADMPSIDARYGRVVLLNTANGNNTLRLDFGKTDAEVDLARNATLAVEVTRQFVPGRDPRKHESPVIVKLYAPDGGVVWRDASGEKTIDAPSEWTITNGEWSEIATDPALPEWIDHEPVVNRSEQLYGAPVVEETLTTDRPADNQLLELFLDGERKRKEVKSLAARSSIHVGLFVPFVEALRDSQQRPNWEKHIEALRSAMALDPQAAEGIWQTLVDKRGEAAAADLYEMLCGYSAEQVGRTPEQIRSGAIADLIDRLESDSLDYRVLAVHNLSEITGKRLMPNPAAGLSERARGVRLWRLRLESDELGPREEK